MSSRFRHFFLGLAAVMLAGSLLGCDALIPWLDGEDQRALQRCTPVSSTRGPVGEWEHLGLSGEEIGQIRAVAVNPCDLRVIYAGTSSDFSTGIPSRLFKSTDGGATWDTLFTGSTKGGGITDIEVDPYRPDTVYALSGAVLKSTDGGRTWRSSFEGSFRPSVLEIDPKKPETLYLGTNGPEGGALYESTDGGTNWKELDEGSTNGITSLAVDSTNTEVVYAGTDWTGDLFRSTDGGENWNLIKRTDGIVDDLLVVPSQSDLIYAAAGEKGILRTEDGGASWQAFNEGLPEEGTAFKLERRAGELFLAYPNRKGEQLYRRQEGSEEKWTPFGVDTPKDQSPSSLKLVNKDHTLYFGADGLYRIKLDLDKQTQHDRPPTKKDTQL